MIISITSFKGGVYRSTTAMLLAAALWKQGKSVAVIDTMTHGTPSEWAKKAVLKGSPLPFSVGSFGVPNDEALAQAPEDRNQSFARFENYVHAVHAAVGSDGIVIIDMRRFSSFFVEKLNELVDVAIVPFDFSPLSIQPTLMTLDSIRASTWLLRCGVEHNGDQHLERNLPILEREGVSHFITEIPFAKEYARAYGDGLTSGARYPHFASLAKEILVRAC